MVTCFGYAGKAGRNDEFMINVEGHMTSSSVMYLSLCISLHVPLTKR